MALIDSWAGQVVAVGVASYLLVRLVMWWLRYRAFFNFFNSLPGETDFHWIWGNVHKLSHNTEERLAYTRSLLEKYPRFYRTWVGPFNAVLNLVHPDTVKTVLKSTEPKPMDPGEFYYYALPWLGRGLLLAGGERWSRSRRLLTPAFHFDILKPYVSVYNQCVEVLLGKIDKYAASGESFELFGNVSLCTLDIILRCAMSYQNDIQMKGETHPYVQAVVELTNLWARRTRQPLCRSDWIYKLTPDGRRFLQRCSYVHSVADDIINSRRRQGKTQKSSDTSGKHYLDFLDILLTAQDEKGQGLSHEEIRSEVDTFLFEGHDTTASAISWTLYSLATNPELQRRVQEELDAVLADRAPPQLQQADLSRLPLLGRCIKEGLRLHVPVPFIQRKLTKDTPIDGHLIPAGTTITIHIWHLHHHNDLWPDPWTFNPDRFLSGKAENVDPFGYVPFSAGPRNCIGQHFATNEEKVVIGRILHRFTLEADPNHVVKRKMAAVTRSENGIKIIAKPRLASSGSTKV